MMSSVTLHRSDGNWVLNVANINGPVVPFGERVKEVRDRIQNVHSKFHLNEELSRSLIAEVEYFDTNIEVFLADLTEMTPRAIALFNHFMDEFKAILRECITIFEAIHFRCIKWLDKKFYKHLMSHDMYNQELTHLKRQLKDNHDSLDLIFLQIDEVKKEADFFRRTGVLDGADTREVLRQARDVAYAEAKQRLGTMTAQANNNADQLIQGMEVFAKNHLEHLVSELGKLNLEKVLHKWPEETKAPNEETRNYLHRLESKTQECLGAIQEEIKNGNPNDCFRLFHSESCGSQSTSTSKVSRSSTSKPGNDNDGDPVLLDDWKSDLAGLTVTEVSICSGPLESGDTSIFGREVADIARFASFFVLAIPTLPAMFAEAGVRWIRGEEDRSPKTHANFVRNNGLFVFCHYWANITFSNGRTCWIDRTAEHQDPKDKKKVTPLTGVHLFWGEEPKRVSKYIFRRWYSPKRHVTLADLVVFCEGEQGQHYNTLNNNCKHFCYRLIKDVMGIKKFDTFADFTAKHNAPV